MTRLSTLLARPTPTSPRVAAPTAASPATRS